FTHALAQPLLRPSNARLPKTLSHFTRGEEPCRLFGPEPIDGSTPPTLRNTTTTTFATDSTKCEPLRFKWNPTPSFISLIGALGSGQTSTLPGQRNFPGISEAKHNTRLLGVEKQTYRPPLLYTGDASKVPPRLRRGGGTYE
ncbi:unnamed protein product, partial [Ectocarpus sp. 4 AP-2014]